MARLAAGDPVHTPFGKGIVREVRGPRWILVDIGGRALVLEEETLSPIDAREKKRRRNNAQAAAVSEAGDAANAAARAQPAAEIDLHGLTVDEALGRVEAAVNDALLADATELRVIHGRSGGRIRGALHAWLRHVRSVRSFSLDPRNPGVTIVRF
jgi:dsDNA-specific endonuclease/ATPase MutS2